MFGRSPLPHGDESPKCRPDLFVVGDESPILAWKVPPTASRGSGAKATSESLAVNSSLRLDDSPKVLDGGIHGKRRHGGPSLLCAYAFGLE